MIWLNGLLDNLGKGGHSLLATCKYLGWLFRATLISVVTALTEHSNGFGPRQNGHKRVMGPRYT